MADARRAGDEHRAHAEPAGTLDIGRQAVADHHGFVRLDRRLPKRRFEDAPMRLHVAVVVGRDGGGEDPLEREVGLKRSQGALRVRDESNLEARGMERAQHVGHILVHLEVMARGPLVVDLPRGALDARSRTAHRLDDAHGVVNEDLRIVNVTAGFEMRGGRHHRAAECLGIDRDVVPRAEVAVADALKRRTRVDQREVDVEEDGAGDRRLCLHYLMLATGPATATAASSGCRSSAAAARTSSSVTARMSSARRRS